MPVALLAWGSAYIWLVAFPGLGRIPSHGRCSRAIAARAVPARLLRVLRIRRVRSGPGNLILRAELFSYGSTVPELTMFAGTKHQFPVYEVISWCGTYTGLASLHYFRDDKGRSLFERASTA